MTTPYKTLAADGEDTRAGDLPVSLPGAAEGDTLAAVFGLPMLPAGPVAFGQQPPPIPSGLPSPTPGPGRFITPIIGTHFESTISVAGQVQQLQAAGNLRGINFVFILEPTA